MPQDRARLEEALRNADAAGDVEAARAIASELRNAQQSQPGSKTASAFRSFLESQKRGAQLVGNTVAQAVSALPLMAGDFGMAVRDVGENVVAGRPTFQKNREYPSEMFRRSLNEIGVTTQPQGIAENAANLVGQAVIGGRLPVPSVNNPPPANFVSPARQALETANRSGYTVPPATARPSSGMSVLEGAAGKLTTAQRASSMNQATTNRLANQAVGLSDEATLSPAVLDTIRSEAGKAHQALRGFTKPIVSDTQYRVELAEAVRGMKNVADKFPAMAQRDVLKIADEMAQPRFDADSAVDAISLLRDRASTAYSSGDRTLGKAYRDLSNAFESLVERRLEQGGAADLVKNFRDARELIAKTYTIQGALRGENVDAIDLARALDKGKYLSGTLRQIGQFAQKFPKAARVTPGTESLPAYSPLDFTTAAASIAGGLATGNPAVLLPAAYAASRPLIRNFLLSPTGQRMLTQEPINALAPAAGAAAPLLNAAAQR